MCTQVLARVPWHPIIGYPLSSVYVNTLLCNLNVRDQISNFNTEEESYELRMPVSVQVARQRARVTQVMTLKIRAIRANALEKDSDHSTTHATDTLFTNEGSAKFHDNLRDSSIVGTSPIRSSSECATLLTVTFVVSVEWNV